MKAMMYFISDKKEVIFFAVIFGVIAFLAFLRHIWGVS